MELPWIRPVTAMRGQIGDEIMIWNTLQIRAEKMGYEVAFRSRYSEETGFMPDLTPPVGQGWVLVGSYDHVAGFWVKPVTEGTAKLNGNLVRKLMADCDPFVETIGDYDSDFFQAQVPFLAITQNLESG